jgi:hypothetical protein
MFPIIRGRKSQLRRVTVLGTLLLLLCSFALPASAAPPQDLSFTFDVTYAPIPIYEGSGSWSSGGLISGSGDLYESVVVGGFDGCPKTVHITTVLTGPTPADSVTVRQQHIRRAECSSPGSPGTYEGNWVIVSATGDYAGLRGQGQLTATTEVQFISGVGPALVVHTVLQGRGHFR